jgi:hypothetical protein
MNKAIQLIVFSMLLCCIVQSSPLLNEEAKIDVVTKAAATLDKVELKVKKLREIVDEDEKQVHKNSIDEDIVKPVEKHSVIEEVKPVHKDSVDEEVKPVHKDSLDEDVKPVQKDSVDEDDIKPVEKNSDDEIPKGKKVSLKKVATSTPKSLKRVTTEATDIDSESNTEKSIKKLSVESSEDDSETTTTTQRAIKAKSTQDSGDSETDSSSSDSESSSSSSSSSSSESASEDKREDKKEDKKEEKKVEKRSFPESHSSDNVTVTPCESSPEFKYYQPHPTDSTKYYICDPWGTGIVQSCEHDLIWNNWLLKCDKIATVKNMTSYYSPILQSNTNKTVLNCSTTEFQCLNGGICTETLGFYKCVCTKEFTGEFCESRIDITDLTHDILNGKFSVFDYKLRLAEENITMEMDYYRRYKDQLDNVTYGELIKYLSMYNNSEIRYDTLINRLIEDILHDIYPDAEYLSSFNASSQYVVSMIKLMPSLLSYSRYSFERYDQVFAQYQKVLSYLVINLNRTLPVLVNEATEYVTLTEVFLNQTVLTLNQTISENRTLMVENSSKKNIQLSEKEITQDLKANFNITLKATEKLFEKIEKFEQNVKVRMETDPKIYTVLLGECKIDGSVELIELFNEIAASSAQVWDSLVNYGFWYITNNFSTTIKRDNADKFQLSLH